jgi:hypothetical protein
MKVLISVLTLTSSEIEDFSGWSIIAKVAKVLVETLIEAGVKRAFGVAGDSLNGITDTIRRSDKMWHSYSRMVRT